MAEIHNLSSPQMDVKDTLRGLLRKADELEAHGAIVLLIHGDDQISISLSHDFSFPSIAGYLMTGIVGFPQGGCDE